MIEPDGYPSVLDTMVYDVQVRGPVGELLRTLPIGNEAAYKGPVMPVGVDKVLVQPEFGQCDVVTADNGHSFLVVHDAFPVALEQAGIPEDAAWLAAAIFAGLKEALHVRADRPRTQQILSVAKRLPSDPEFWDFGAPDSQAINRLAAGMTLHHLGIPPNSLEIPDEPPYPSHIAAFIDPIRPGLKSTSE